MDPIEWLRHGVGEAVATLQTAGRLPAGLDLMALTLEPAEESGRGDFASNADLVLSRQAGRPARAVAGDIAEALGAVGGIAGVEIAGPGFLNLTLAPTRWADMLAALLAAGERYGASERGEGETVTLAFRPPDPKSRRAISPARRDAVGTALANMLDRLGFQADRRFGEPSAQADLTVRLGPLRVVTGQAIAGIDGRTGDELDLAALAGSVGEDAARLGLVMHPAATALDLDLDLLADQSHANPAFHLHYAHARCHALRQAGAALVPDVGDRLSWDISAFEDEGARLILRHLALYPRQIDLAVRQSEPCRLAQHLHGLAAGLHRQYYRSLGAPYLRFIRDDDRLLTGARLALVLGVEMVLKSGLALLGSCAPGEMR